MGEKFANQLFKCKNFSFPRKKDKTCFSTSSCKKIKIGFNFTKKYSYILGCCNPNWSLKFDVLDEDGNKLFLLDEKSGCLMRVCCYNSRGVVVSFQDLDGKEILRFDR